MRICRFAIGNDVGFGVVAGEPGSELVTALDGHPFAPFALSEHSAPLTEVRLLAPVLPSKVIGIGNNYPADPSADLPAAPPADPPAGPQPGPAVFLKPSTSVIGPGDPIQHPRDSSRTEFEGELAIVISRLCREVPRERAHDVVLGYTIANDVTAGDQLAADGQWTRSKGHDTFCPIGPWIETDLDPTDLALTTRLDGEVRQQARTSQLLYDIPSAIAFVSSFMTLLPGDVILTGTPTGAGPMRPGQRVEVEIEGIGVLGNPVVDRD